MKKKRKINHAARAVLAVAGTLAIALAGCYGFRHFPLPWNWVAAYVTFCVLFLWFVVIRFCIIPPEAYNPNPTENIPS